MRLAIKSALNTPVQTTIGQKTRNRHCRVPEPWTSFHVLPWLSWNSLYNLIFELEFCDGADGPASYSRGSAACTRMAVVQRRPRAHGGRPRPRGCASGQVRAPRGRPGPNLSGNDRSSSSRSGNHSPSSLSECRRRNIKTALHKFTFKVHFRLTWNPFVQRAKFFKKLFCDSHQF